MRRLALLVGIVALSVSGMASAQTRVPPASLAHTQLGDPVKEAQARTLMATLRCLVCQGQSIIDSDADMAGDMRALVRQRIAAGQTPDAVRDWLIARYGAYVSYDPPLSVGTAPLWLTPLVLLAIGGWLARGSFRKRRR
ncbi:cytochrome C biogenesis protein [Sphingomonas sp. Leaf17]|uniref:cytochrome c-type biogenesis protein n=1 Tax=Sphingomonas sp. Leaf17 TaxID=1735683 RepID=UPI0006F9443D|nr:cytochrome c-type biogenesis protein [Sphingomonas sp. Leaf17]KQM63806.1 cytochrome C biogenesis protein [Sphingomonas sp. Leaf17]